MRFLLVCVTAVGLTAAGGFLSADEPKTTPPAGFDFPKFFTEFQVARNKAIAAAKTPPGEQPPFESLRPHLEKWAKAVADDPDGKPGAPARRQLLTYLALYPTAPRAKELLDEAARPLTVAERAGVTVSVGQALLREVGLPSHTAAEAAELNAKAEALLEKVLADAEGSVKKRAENALYVARHLSVGKKAPAVTSRDLDGKEVKLSDYRGKVVVLDFWFVGCMPCRAMIPHQRELVGRLKDKPFALISISADKEKEELTKFLAGTEMPWVHWYNGFEGGMVADWKVTAFPTIYVLDAQGVIRFKDVRGASLDKAVDLLLAEMAADDKLPRR